MVAIGNAIFLQLPGSSERPVLHPGKVLGLHRETCTVAVEAEDLRIAEGQDVLVYFEKDREFLKQAARIDSAEPGCPDDDDESCTGTRSARDMIDDVAASGLIVVFTVMGEPVSAERRETYRVSTVMMNLTTSFGKEAACPILDVSATGFALISTVRYELANMTDATITVDDKTYTGKVSVQSVRDLGRGRFRYGLHGIDEDRSTGALSKGLHRMSVKAQREQLRRLSGTV